MKRSQASPAATAQGPMSAERYRFGLVVSRFHDDITSRLQHFAVRTLKARGCRDENMAMVHVPGAFEIPLLALKLAESRRFDAILCLGCVIRGQTPHFEYICRWAATGIGRVGLDTGVPTIFGVITADNLEQAVARSREEEGNKGVEAALSAIEMCHVLASLERDR